MQRWIDRPSCCRRDAKCCWAFYRSIRSKRERERESPLTVLRQGKSRMILISIWALPLGLGSLMQQRHPSIHPSIHPAIHLSIHPSIALPRRPERQFSTIKGRKVMISRCLAETRQRFSRLARDIVQQALPRYGCMSTTSRTLILPDPNCRPGYMSSLLRRDGSRFRGFENPCHSEISHVRVPRTNVPWVLQRKYHVAANAYRVQAFNIYRSFLSKRQFRHISRSRN